MADIVSKETRSRMMSGIKGKDTRPELIIRKALHARGFRYRLHDKKLPGKPDLVFPKHSAVIFIQGCFWHGHSCHLFKWPKSREEFWRQKILGNIQRDGANEALLSELDWRIGKVWECSVKGKWRLSCHEIVNGLASFLENKEVLGIEIKSRPPISND